MKKERFSFFVLFIEIAAIVLLHSAKSHQSTIGNSVAGSKKTSTSAAYQLKAFSLTKIK